MEYQCQHLSPNEQERLLNVLRNFEGLFGGTLGTWKTPPVDLDLKDDAIPVCSCPYPVQRVHEAIFRKEVERLVKLGVLEELNDSEWGSPSFAQPKPKTNRAGFLSDLQN